MRLLALPWLQHRYMVTYLYTTFTFHGFCISKSRKSFSLAINKKSTERSGAEINFWFVHFLAIAALLICRNIDSKAIAFSSFSTFCKRNCLSWFRIFAGLVLFFCNQHYLCLPCRDYRVIAPSALINERASHVQWHYFPFSRHLLGILIIYDSFLISWFLYKAKMFSKYT